MVFRLTQKKICILILLKQQEDKFTLSVNTPTFKGRAKEFTVVPVKSEVNLRQQDWVETKQKKSR
jgi:hypothetical protein